MKQKTLIGVLVILVMVLIIYIMTSGDSKAPSGSEVENETDSGMLEGGDGESAGRYVEEFKGALESKVVAEHGQPIEGFVPQMFLAQFRELLEQDFDGVEASIGHYRYRDNELVHDLEGETMVHSAADSITDEGYRTLFENVMKRFNFMMNDNIKALITKLEGHRNERPKDDGRPSVPPVSDEVVVCTDEMKQAEACTMEYAPVCGLVDVQCVTTPCNPVPETFSNGCSACAQGNVISYTEGECTLSDS